MARFRTVSDRSLSLWQSAVTETVQKQAGVQEPVKTDAEEKETEETEKPIQQCLVEGSCLFTTEQNLILAALGIQVKQEQNTAGNEGTAQGSVEDRHEDKAERKTESSAGVTAGEERADRHMGDRKVSADEASEGVETEAVMTSPNTGDAVLNLPDTASDMGQASRLMFEAALAKAEGSEEEALRLMREARKYSTGDLAGWLSCITTYLEYDARYDAPYYRDWKLDGRDIGTYGVVSHVLPGDAKVGLIGDWATGMPDARELIACILDQDVDAVIHLGDTYYSGTPEECRRNFKEVFDEVFAKTGKPRIPVYSIPGNHDYYAFGYGFYQEILDEINRGNRNGSRRPAISASVRKTAPGNFSAWIRAATIILPTTGLTRLTTGPGWKNPKWSGIATNWRISREARCCCLITSFSPSIAQSRAGVRSALG